jgi:hypothetical protein
MIPDFTNAIEESDADNFPINVYFKAKDRISVNEEIVTPPILCQI